MVVMKMTGYKDNEFSKQIPGKAYKVMINPESIKWHRSIDYNKEAPLGSNAPSQTYNHSPIENLSFDIIIDCTGIVDKKRTIMSVEIAAIEKIIYTYNGDIHRPNYVIVQWGENLIFKSVLLTFNTTYTLFKPDGSPLRAKISLSFGKYTSAKDVKKKNCEKSPDVTHLVDVEDGNSLPQLCDKVWNDQSYYVQLAKFNGLNKFRHLKGGKQLIFPPIIQSA